MILYCYIIYDNILKLKWSFSFVFAGQNIHSYILSKFFFSRKSYFYNTIGRKNIIVVSKEEKNSLNFQEIIVSRGLSIDEIANE